MQTRSPPTRVGPVGGYLEDTHPLEGTGPMSVAMGRSAFLWVLKVLKVLKVCHADSISSAKHSPSGQAQAQHKGRTCEKKTTTSLLRSGLSAGR